MDITIHYMHDSVNNEKIELLRSFIIRRGGNIKTYKIDKKIFPNWIINGHGTEVTYFKYLGIHILKDIDKMFYLEIDTLVLRSLRELWETDFEDNYFFVLKLPPNVDNFLTSRNFEMRLPRNTQFTSCACLGINLKELRKVINFNDILEIIEKNKLRFIFHNEDILNMLWNDKIKGIDKIFNANALVRYEEERKKTSCNSFLSIKTMGR